MKPLAVSPDTIVKETIAAYQKHHNPALARLLKLSGLDIVEWEGEGVILRDVYGKEYIDCLGGYGVFSLGHRHPKVLEAVSTQLHRLPLSGKIFFNKPLADLCKKLSEITPGDLQFSFIANSGTEAVEGALKLARLSTGKPQIISAENAFHGKTLGSLSVSGRAQYKVPFEPLIPEFVQVPFGDINLLKRAINEQTAAVILEPIQGEGGVCLPPSGYLQQVREVCSQNEVLLILDEVQTGLGRTGKWFACEHFDLVPDILVLAKALGGGVMPIGAFVGTPQVWKAFQSEPLIHTSTFGGNPLACSAALAAIDVMQEENLPSKAADLGAYFLARLKELADLFPDVIQEVRGIGLLVGVELTNTKYGGYLIPEMCKHGILVAYTLNQPKVIRFEPPLIITKNELNLVIEVFHQCLTKTKNFFNEEKSYSIR